MITIIDYGLGNINAIYTVYKNLNIPVTVASNPSELDNSEKFILPGVGAFDYAMEKLNTLGFSKVLKEKADSGTPIMGICLGMQLLGTFSDEGNQQGLNLISGAVRKFPKTSGLRIPHMGWNSVKISDSKMSENLEENKFYFVHSYYYKPEQPKHVLGITKYGIEFASIINSKNIFGVQFHPEKSHKYGMELLKNFDRF